MVYSMSGFIKDTMKLQNLLMILMEICLILEFILLFFQNYAFSREMENCDIFCMAGCLISFFMVGLLSDHQHRQDDLPYDPILYSFPIHVLVIAVILLTAYLILAIRRERKEYSNTLSPWSVYEAVNNVPCGVCFSDALGRIILSNAKMQELCRILTEVSSEF